MKKFLGSFFFLGVIVLSGCTTTTTSVPTTTPTNTITQNDLFEKNKQCLSYKEQIESDLIDTQAKSKRGEYSLEQIFYSPKRQACFFVSIVENKSGIEKRLYQYGNHSYYSESEFTCNYYFDENGTKQDNRCSELDERVKELKGE